MAEETENNAEGGGSKKKMMIIIGAVVLLGVGAFVATQLFGETDKTGKASSTTKEEVLEYDPIALEKKVLLTVDLGKFTASMQTLSAGNKNRRSITMHPELLLKPFIDTATGQFDDVKNQAMIKRYESAKAILRQLIFEVVNQMESSPNIGPRSVAKQLKDKINSYDTNENNLKTHYNMIFGKRVLRVNFLSYDSR